MEFVAPGLLKVVIQPPPAIRYLGYWAALGPNDGDWLLASMDAAGNVIAFSSFLPRDPTVNSAEDFARCAPVAIDDSGLVGVGALLVPSGGDLRAIDFASGLVHLESWPGRKVAGAAYVAGRVYAIVHDQSSGATCDVDLFSLPTDLSSQSSLASVSLAPAGATGSNQWFPSRNAAVGPDAAYISVEYGESEAFFGYQAGVLPYSGSSTQGPEFASAGAVPSLLAVPALDAAYRGRWRWLGGFDWEEFAPSLIGTEGSASAESAVIYDGATVIEVDPDNVGTPSPVPVPSATHPQIGVIGTPDLLFPFA